MSISWCECISWYECEIITQIHNFGCRELSVAMIYGEGKIAECQGKVREFLFPDHVGTLSNHMLDITGLIVHYCEKLFPQKRVPNTPEC